MYWNGRGRGQGEGNGPHLFVDTPRFTITHCPSYCSPSLSNPATELIKAPGTGTNPSTWKLYWPQRWRPGWTWKWMGTTLPFTRANCQTHFSHFLSLFGGSEKGIFPLRREFSALEVGPVMLPSFSCPVLMNCTQNQPEASKMWV